jgi:protein-S-isoprenylcysteine O-methyltransferase Ste14
MNYYILITGTIIIVVFSWFFSIREKRYHGIARFFAFESIFILVVLNLRYWFKDPFSWYQVLSWIFLVASIYPGIAGYLLLKRHGKSDKSFENTTELVKSGVYGYIRHPLYGSLLLLGTGVMFKQLHLPQVILGMINIVAIFLTARIEEKEMIARFGDQYNIYMKETKMFIPFLI